MEMGFLSADTGLIGQAATDLAAIHSGLDETMTSIAGPTTALEPAGQDEISAALAKVFGDSGTQFQAYRTQAAQFHSSLVKLMHNGAMAYAEAEATNAAATAAESGGDFAALPTQIGGAVEGFLGEQLKATGELIGDIGSGLVVDGEFLSPEGTVLTEFANSNLATLMTGGLSIPREGE